MLETGNSRIDIKALERQIKWDARKYGYLWQGERVGGKLPVPNKIGESGIAQDSTQAAFSLANVESPNYTLQRYPRPLRWIASFAARTVLYLSRIVTHAQTQFNYQVVQAVETLDRQASTKDANINAIEGVVGWLDGQVEGIEQRLGMIDERLSRAESERFDHGQELESIRTRLPGVEEELRSVLASLEQCQSGLGQQLGRLSTQERVLEQLKRGPQEQVAPVSAGAGRTASAAAELDGFYMVFEDRFRGTSQEVSQRLAEYLPLVDDCLAQVEGEGIVIDLGCGRGDWLKLLIERGVQARGIDSNTGFVGQCEKSGLDVVEQDALAYLASLPEESVSMVTGFHIIEHLEFDDMVRLIDEVRRVLKQGGMLIFETPNPKNLIVGACNFYADPTHVRQVFPELLEFVVQGRGFRSVALRYLNPHPEHQQLSREEAPILADQLNHLLSCARDFAVIGYK